jgi:hypothetical protein
MRVQEFSIETPLISSGEIGIHGDEVRYHGSPVEGGIDITEIVRKELEGAGIP